MNNLSLFPSAAALTCAPKSKRPRPIAKSHQMAYLEFLSVVLNRPVAEVVAQAATKKRKPAPQLVS